MITMLVFVRRKEGVSREEFQRYWRYEHAALTKTVHGFWDRIQRYVQYYPIDNASFARFGAQVDCDGIGQMWFDSVEDMLATFDHPGYREIIQPHEAEFVRFDGFEMFVAEEVLQHEA